MSNTPTLLTPYTLGNIQLKNRVIMAPLTRCRAIDNVPNEMMAEYYAQRASAGLIITEGTAPSKNGLGYARTPGIYSPAQLQGWEKVTDAVHKKGGKIFIQLMHVGRVGHPLNVPDGGTLMSPSAVALDGTMHTDEQGAQPYPQPKAMTEKDIEDTIEEYVQAAKNAVKVGFDGIELHGANGYLIEQFLNPASNHRTDKWGGSPENRNRFAIELARRTIAAIGKNRVGIRLSPGGTFSGMEPFFEGMEAQFEQLAAELGELGVVYLHLVDHSAIGTPEIPVTFKRTLNAAFKNTFMLSGGYDDARAEADLTQELGDLVAFGRPFISNADLVERFEQNAPLNEPERETFYSAGRAGYTDYPTLRD